MKRAGWLVALGIGVAAATARGAAGTGGPQVVRLENPYVVVSVNASPDATGRFTIGTTGGNPDRPDDDRRPLLYGGDEPWTSFTTVRIGSTSYVFGGETHRPAGQGGPFGQPVTPPRLAPDGQAIEAAWEFPPGIEVVQRLSLARGVTTGLMDTVRIEYVVTNRTRNPQTVGLRLVLDTMAGSNDGAPFRVGERAIETDTLFRASEGLPAFWQVFDSLTQPAVIAQGTFSGRDVSTPDRVYFTNWGALRESLWEFDFREGRAFGRKGEEYELDSAVALFFDPRTLPPGESRSYVTYYGLGGISIAPGQLAVGLSGPESAVIGQAEPVTVVAYVQNTGRGAARNLTLTLQVPQGLAAAPGEALTRRLAELPAGSIVQAVWRLRVTAERPQEATYSVVAQADNAEPNRARRTIRLVSPARLTIRLEGPGALSVVDGRWAPVPFPVVAEVVNEGGAEADRLWARLQTVPYVLKMAPGDHPERFIGTLRPGERYRMRWHLVPAGPSGNPPYAVRVLQLGSAEPLAVANRSVVVPPLGPTLILRRLDGGQQVAPGQAIAVAVEALNLPAASSAQLELALDPAKAELAGGPLGVDRGQPFLARPSEGPAPEFAVQVDPAGGRVILRAGSGRPWESPEVRLAVLRVLARQPADAAIRVLSATFRSPDGQVVWELKPGDPSLPSLSLAVRGAPREGRPLEPDEAR